MKVNLKKILIILLIEKKNKEKARQQRNDPIHSFIRYHKCPFLYKLCPAVCRNHKNQYRHSTAQICL